MIVLNDCPTRLMSIPALDASDLIASQVAVAAATPVEYTQVSLSCWPFLIPVPHLAGAGPVTAPPSSPQPWLVSWRVALPILIGDGPFPPFSRWIGGTYGMGSVVGAGPEVGVAYPRQMALEIPCWSITICTACRT